MSEPVDDPCPLSSGLTAWRRLVAIAATDAGQSRAVADSLLARRDARACGGFDLAARWSVATSVRDLLVVLGLIAHHREFPTAWGLGEAFTGLVGRWRPDIVQAHR